MIELSSGSGRDTAEPSVGRLRMRLAIAATPVNADSLRKVLRLMPKRPCFLPFELLRALLLVGTCLEVISISAFK